VFVNTNTGLAAPFVLPKIVAEGQKVQQQLFGPAPQLFVSMSGHAVAEAVRRGERYDTTNEYSF